MVWNTTQSALYKAIDAFNNGEEITIKQTAFDNKSNGCDPGKSDADRSPCSGARSGDEERRCDAQPGCAVNAPQMNCPCCRPCQNRPASPLSQLISDRDMLLIAGLILLLSQQNADRKLIMALAFVLLS